MKNGYIKFWGVRGSHPTPDENKSLFGGDTSCVEIRTKNDLFIFDMGSGLRNLGTEMISDKSTPKNINIFLSHYHWDHIVGFLSFKPLFDSSFIFNIYGYNKNTDIKHVSDKLLDSTVWPVSMDMLLAKVNFKNLSGDKMRINDHITVRYTSHPHPNDAASYKLSINDYSILYTTDCEHENENLNQNVLDIANGADVLIHDSHFLVEDLPKHKGWGHSSWKEAIDVAEKTNIKDLILFHFSPEYDDDTISIMQKEAKKIFPNTIAAKQGMKIEF